MMGVKDEQYEKNKSAESITHNTDQKCNCYREPEGPTTASQRGDLEHRCRRATRLQLSRVKLRENEETARQASTIVQRLEAGRWQNLLDSQRTAALASPDRGLPTGGNLRVFECGKN